MAAPTEAVVVTIGGEPYPYVLAVSVKFSAEQGVRSGSIKGAEPDGRFWAPPGAPVVITAWGEPVLTGFVRDYDTKVSKGDRQVVIAVESKTCDVAESSVVHKTGRVEKKTLDKAATEFGRGLGARFRVEGGALDPIPAIVTHPGETLFSLVERYARSQGIYVTDDAKGDQVLFQGTRGRHKGVLALPGNVLEGSGHLSERNRASKTTVRGQHARKWDKRSLRAEASVTDTGVKRHRPRLVIHEGEADAKRLKRRAAYDRKRGAGGSITASVELATWRDEAGKIWTPAYVIPLDAWDKLRIQQDMAIASGQLDWSKEGGTSASLELRDPSSFAKSGGKAKGQASGKASGKTTVKTAGKTGVKTSGSTAGGTTGKSGSETASGGTASGAKAGGGVGGRADVAWAMPEGEPMLEVEA